MTITGNASPIYQVGDTVTSEILWRGNFYPESLKVLLEKLKTRGIREFAIDFIIMPDDQVVLDLDSREYRTEAGWNIPVSGTSQMDLGVHVAREITDQAKKLNSTEAGILLASEMPTRFTAEFTFADANSRTRRYDIYKHVDALDPDKVNPVIETLWASKFGSTINLGTYEWLDTFPSEYPAEVLAGLTPVSLSAREMVIGRGVTLMHNAPDLSELEVEDPSDLERWLVRSFSQSVDLDRLYSIMPEILGSCSVAPARELGGLVILGSQT